MELPSVVSFDPYSPRINLDSKCVIAYHSSIVNLKEHISKILREPVENRIFLLKSGVCLCLLCSVIACKCLCGALTLKCFTVSEKPDPGDGEPYRDSDKQKNKMGKNLIDGMCIKGGG